MSIINTKIPVEVVVREDTQTEYVCDGCEVRYLIGEFNRSEAINNLHPPRSWWEVGPADGSDRYGQRRVRHACGVACLQKVVSLMAVEVLE